MSTYAIGAAATLPPAKLYDAHAEMAERLPHRFCRSLRRDSHTFDDARQTAHLALWEAAVAFRPDLGTTFETFAFGRISGALNNFRRKAKTQTRPELHLDLSCLSAQAQNDGTVEGVFPAQIGRGEREVLTMHYQDGLTVPQVARQLGVSPYRAAYLLRKARAHLRSSLSAQAQYTTLA